MPGALRGHKLYAELNREYDLGRSIGFLAGLIVGAAAIALGAVALAALWFAWFRP